MKLKKPHIVHETVFCFSKLVHFQNFGSFSAPQKILKVVSTLLKSNSLSFGLNHSGKSLLYLGTTIPRYNSYYWNSQDKQICSKVVQMLLDYGENPNTHLAYFIPLMSAIKEEDLTTVDILVKAGADVNALNEDGQTCLHILFARNVVTGKS